MLDLIERLEGAEGGSRGLDHAIAYELGIGVEKERKLWAEMGEAMFVADAHGLTPLGRARGDIVRQEWVPGSRGKRGHYKDVLWTAFDGPAPLRSCPAYTTSLDAITALMAEKLRVGPITVTMAGSGICCIDNIDACGQGIQSFGNTPPLACCIALLRALQTKEQTHGG